MVSTMIGSGTIYYTRGILPSSQRGAQPNSMGERFGVQTIIANPEDLVAVDAFAVSGIQITTAPIKIWGAGSNPLPRARLLRIQNATDSTTVTIANSAAKTPEGWTLVNNGAGTPRSSVDLPILDCCEVWAVASAASQVRMLIF
jgi:hypothetical protein